MTHERSGKYQWLDRVAEAGGRIPPHLAAAAVVFWKYANADGTRSYPSNTTVGRAWGASRETGNKWAADLRALGVLVDTGERVGGKVVHNLVTPPWLVEPGGVPPAIDGGKVGKASRRTTTWEPIEVEPQRLEPVASVKPASQAGVKPTSQGGVKSGPHDQDPSTKTLTKTPKADGIGKVDAWARVAARSPVAPGGARDRDQDSSTGEVTQSVSIDAGARSAPQGMAGSEAERQDPSAGATDLADDWQVDILARLHSERAQHESEGRGPMLPSGWRRRSA